MRYKAFFDPEINPEGLVQLSMRVLAVCRLENTINY